MIDYTIYLKVTCCDSKGNVKTGLDKIALVNNEVIENILSTYIEYYTVISWEIWSLPKSYKEK